MKIELMTYEHSDYVSDRVTFESDGDWVEINHEGDKFSVRTDELLKVLAILCSK